MRWTTGYDSGRTAEASRGRPRRGCAGSPRLARTPCRPGGTHWSGTLGEELDGLRERFSPAPLATPGQALQSLALAPGVPRLDGDGHQRLAPGERGILIALAAQQSV